jgi:cytochrome c oxidase subunit 1
MYPETFGKLSALTIFIGFNLTFFPQFIMGYMGMPRRYHSYVEDYTVWHVASSCGASILIGGYIMTVAYLLWSLKYGQRASANPWGAKGLEWTTPSPPPTENFHKMPVVREEAYAYNIDEEEDVHETV